MEAALLTSPAAISQHPLRITEVPRPESEAVIPGHQIVGEVVDGATATLPLGTRVGVSWIGGVDGDCWYCTHDAENLCDSPTFTGYTVDGGYAEYVLARRDLGFALPTGLGDLQAAPLLRAGIIGFRSLRVAGVHSQRRQHDPRRRTRLPACRRRESAGAARDSLRAGAANQALALLENDVIEGAAVIVP